MLSSSCASAKHSSGITGTVNADELLFLRGPVLRKVKLYHHTRRVVRALSLPRSHYKFFLLSAIQFL